MPPKARQFEISFQKKELKTPNVYAFYFSKPEDFTFLAGQYIRLTVPHEDSDDKGSWRYFTISSSPLDPYIMITTRIYASREKKESRKSSFKHALFHLKKGQKLTAFGPMGILYLEDDDIREKIFLSRGLGITPFYSILRYAAQKNLTQNLTLIASFNFVDEYLFADELQSVHEVDSHMRIHYTAHAQPAELLGTEIPLNKKAQYVITGRQSFIWMTREILLELGIDSEQILTEEFTGY